MIDDYIQSDDYKQKYEDLMKRCEQFNIWFEDHKRRANNSPGTTIFPTTAPWPPIGLQYTYNNICSGCGQDLNKLTHYVCYMSNCPSQMRVTCISTTGTAT